MVILIILVIFFIAVLIYALPASAIIYHLLKFGIKKDLSKIMTIIFIIVSLALIAIALIFVLITDWEAVIQSLNIQIY